MKKMYLLLSVFSVILNSTLAQSLTDRMPNTAIKIEKSRDFSISDESLSLMSLKMPSVNEKGRMKKAAEQQSNIQEVVIDLWQTSNLYNLTSAKNGQIDEETRSFTFPGSLSQVSHILTGVDSTYSYYDWFIKLGHSYTFSGVLTSDGYAEVSPCIVYMHHNTGSLYIISNEYVTLSEENGFSAEFNVSALNNYLDLNQVLMVAFLVNTSEETTTITSTEIKFLESYKTLVAQKWSEETDLPGLGLSDLYQEHLYTVLCEDSVTTLGLYLDEYSGDLYLTGINTSAEAFEIPESITIDGIERKIAHFGYSSNMDWSGAPNLSTLYLKYVTQVYADFGNSTISDIYIEAATSFYSFGSYGFSNIYLHIPYGFSRNNYTWVGFKRVLVGDEQPHYPESSYADFVIVGNYEDEYYGINFIDNTFRICEIFTSKDTIVLPLGTPWNGGAYYILGFGADAHHYSGLICSNAPNLKSVTIPDNYTLASVYWSNSTISELHMQGDVPATDWKLTSNMDLYVAKPYYANYKNNSNWNSANILPDGWDFEWMTVNVGRKGEFAQTYIEMTDANWDLGLYVKVVGELNATDLGNIKNLTNLMKLDLSEAIFTELPQSFLSNKTTLTEVILPDSLTSISREAFYGCSQLFKVTAPGVKKLNSYAFYQCSKLRDLDIANVTHIDSYVFCYCSQYDPDTISSNLQMLGSYAFAYSGITQIEIPETITGINTYVFSNCTNLHTVILPNTITSIGYYAFNNCGKLLGINLPEGLKEIGHDAFENCSLIEEFVLPSTMQTIGYDVFDGCRSLKTVKCKAIVPPTTNGEFTYNIDLNHCVLYVAPFAIDAYRSADDWNRFFIMKPLDEPVKNIYINRPMTFDLLSEDNAVLQENPNMTLDYASTSSVGQLSAKGDGTLSAGVFSIFHKFEQRTNSSDIRTSLLNNADNMRADSVVTTINFVKNRWHFISFPYDIQMKDIVGVDNTDFVIRKYNSINRASGDGTISNWENLLADDMLEAGKGYIIQVANNSTNASGNTNPGIVQFPSRNTTTKNNLFTSKDVTVVLEEYPAEFAHNRSWNLVGNPYPCYYDMHYLKDDFTTPIVLWRGTSYQAYSPIDDDITLRPNEAFFVQRPLEVGQMVFGVEGRLHFNDVYGAGKTPGAYMPSHRAQEASRRHVFNFVLEGNDHNDRTRLVINEEASMEYEISCDASKFFAETLENAEIYVNGGIKYDICERPMNNGVVTLGTRIAKSGTYTITLNGRCIDGWQVILYDTKSGNYADLTEGSYRFDAEAGNAEDRFVLTIKAPVQTAIDHISASEKTTDVRVVDASGIAVYEGNLEHFKNNAHPGVYVVTDSEKAYKIVVK